MSLGKKIKKYRTERGITQMQLAEGIGSYQKNISGYESDEVVPSAEVLKKIASVLEVSPHYFLSDDSQMILDARIIKIAKELDKLKEEEKQAILPVIQAYLRDVKSRVKK